MKTLLRKRNRSSISLNETDKSKNRLTRQKSIKKHEIDRKYDFWLKNDYIWDNSDISFQTVSDLDSKDLEALTRKIDSRRVFVYYLMTYVISTVMFCLSVKFCSNLVKSKIHGVFELELKDLFNFTNVANFLSGARKQAAVTQTEHDRLYGGWYRLPTSIFIWSNLLQISCLIVLHRLVYYGDDITTKVKINFFAEYNKELIFYSSAAQLIQLFLPLVWWIHVLLFAKGLFMVHTEYSWRIKYFLKRKLQGLKNR